MNLVNNVTYNINNYYFKKTFDYNYKKNDKFILIIIDDLKKSALGRALRGVKNGGNKMNKVISVKSNEEIVEDPSKLYNLIKNMY